MASTRRRSVYRAGSDGPLASRPAKKARKEVDFDALPDAHKDIVAQAAEILQVPIINVSGAVRRLHSAPTAPVETSCWSDHQANKTMGSGPDNPSAAATVPMLPSAMHGSGSFPVEGDLLLNEMILIPESPAVDSCFGLSVAPRRWAECLASMAMPEQSPSLEARPDHESFPQSSSCFGTRPEIGGSLFPTQIPYPQNSANLNQTAQLPNTTEKFPSYGSSAGDFMLDPRFQTSVPALASMQVQNTQPIANKQEMTYSIINHSLSSSQWNQNMPETINTASNQIYGWAHNQIGTTGNSSPHSNNWSNGGQDSDYMSSSEKLGSVRRGPFRNPHKRAETAQTRKLAACVRCRMQRIRCQPDPANPRGVCITCKKVTKLKFCKLPCLRYKIVDVKLFKPGQVPGMEWTRRWSTQALEDISTWSHGNVKTIQVTEGYHSCPLTLQVREFVPQAGDMLQRHWVANKFKKSVTLPPYAIVDMAAAERAYWDYINQVGIEFFKNALNYKDKLLWATYETAIATANSLETPEQERKLLNMVLQLWIAIRITTRSIRLSGHETLGMTCDILDETSPLHGHIPIPPVMGAQIELILIQKIQMPLRVQILDMLQKTIEANKRSSWFVVYLTIFILLHNCAMITRHDAGYARKHDIQDRFARPEMVREYHGGANILLTYFHYCNRGLLPFSAESRTTELTTLGGLSPKQANLVESTRKYVRANKTRFEDLRWQNIVEHDHYFVAQLYEENWTPRLP